MDLDDLPRGAVEHASIFRRCLPLQIKLQEILRALGGVEGEHYLDVGSENGMLSHHLHDRGGSWHTVVTDERQAESFRALVGDNVHIAEGQALPFEDKTFDVAVVVDFLEKVESDEAFIEACHRVLKADGRLIVNVAKAKAWTLLRPLRRMLGLTFEKQGRVRPGYTESELFNILKDGFDVHHVRSYSRFFVEFVDTWVRFADIRLRSGMRRDDARLVRLYTVSHVFYRLAHQLDMLLFFNRGHQLIATARRRTWRQRRAPVLTDGRSISEAVLSRPAK